MPEQPTTISNAERKRRQKAAYHAMFKPKQKPRSRRWQKGSTGSGKH